MDLTVAVMLPPREAQDVTRSAHAKMPVLAPVAVYEREPVKTIRNPVLGYLRVTGCPVRSAQELAEKICVPDERHVGDEETLIVTRMHDGQRIRYHYPVGTDPAADKDALGEIISVISEVIPKFETHAKRLYEADAALLPAKITATLLADRQATLTWAEFSAMYVHRQTAQKLSAVVADGAVRG